ncbi:PAS domain S-box protein [Pseudomonas asturiensis]|uniref:histidine kinase n=1 Tax=Pseudomonas asturiensis TaxID=1190415 RepID=A0ABX6HA86_9PSED|nr:ATP-binding protein [Pseudomonas asturiensis]QHF02313.1 PAS domain S-box protein [Pseudomonas asturiensis]
MSQVKPSIEFRHWIWRAFLRTSLVPLVVVELALLTAYFLANQSILDSQSNYLHQNATRELQASVKQNADIVDSELEQISSLSQLLASTVETELAETLPYEPAKLATSPDGVRYSDVNDGGAASFYSNITPLDRQDLDMVSRLKRVDFMLKALKDGNPLITSVYFNSADSYNRIYPWIDTLAQYPHDMNIPLFNFYYLADTKHNPLRIPVWTDVYLDPAGNGWMMSVVTPVYIGDTLKGVVGIDVTVDAILQKIARLHVPWAGYLTLVSKEHTIMALPTEAESDFGVPPLESSAVYTKIRREHFKSSEFSLASHPDLRALDSALKLQPEGLISAELDKRTHLMAWSKIRSAEWNLLAVVEEHIVMQEIQHQAKHFQYVGYLMVAGLLAFYAVFFAYLWMRSRSLSRQISLPMLGLANMMREIGQGNWAPRAPRSSIKELNTMSSKTLDMGRQLDAADARQRAAQQRLQIVLENVTEGMWEYTPQSDTFMFKGPLCTRFGLPATNVSPKHLLGLMPEEDRQGFWRLLEAVQAKEACVAEVEFRLPDRQGELIWLLCRASTLSSPATCSTTVVGTCVDIDTLKQVEHDLREKTIEAQAASQTKSRFISSMSHELRTPLNAIQGFAQLSQLHPDVSPAQAHAYTQEIMNASKHLQQLVEALLEWSSLQAEAPRLTLKPVDVETLFQECFAMITPQTFAQGLSLKIRSLPQPCLIIADGRRVKQVLINLLTNAAKYNRANGSIVIGAEVDEQQQVVRLFVEDTGQGIDAELLEQLFQPFQRLGKENSKIQGTGIGLALCRELAELMNGKMGVISKVATGSRFWIELPMGFSQNV